MSHQHQPIKAPRPPQRHRPSLFWPIVLIVSGIVLLLSNLGYLPEPSWGLLWRLWPVLLIALGLDVLIGRRSVAGAVISGLLIFVLLGGVILLVFFARNIPQLADLASAPTVKHEFVSHPLGEIEQATIVIDFTEMPGRLKALEDGAALIEGDIDVYGDLLFEMQEENGAALVELDTVRPQPLFDVNLGRREAGVWDLALHPDVAYELLLDGGSGALTLDLSELSVTKLELDQGSGAVVLTLPSTSSFSGTIEGGSGSLRIKVPEETGLRIELDDGSGAFHTDERFVLVSGDPDDNSVWRTENYDEAEYKIELEIDQGSGTINVGG
ncbi:MAG: LiaI-LiaF-like domain-containing protein [Anaerolineae bacterium]